MNLFKWLALALLFSVFVIQLAAAQAPSAGPLTATPTSSAGNAPTTLEGFLTDAASPVTYYYSENSNDCPECSRQIFVLWDMSQMGFRFKTVSIGDKARWNEYKITRVPMFVASDGSQLAGLPEKGPLAKWLEEKGAKVGKPHDIPLSLYESKPIEMVTSPYSFLYDDASPVAYYFNENCKYCSKQLDVLWALSQEGFRVKPVDVGTSPGAWEKYGVSGVPTFVASDGSRLVGQKDGKTLEKWLLEKGAKTGKPHTQPFPAARLNVIGSPEPQPSDPQPKKAQEVREERKAEEKRPTNYPDIALPAEKIVQRFNPGPGFSIPPEALEGFIFSEIGDKMLEKYGEGNLLSKCGNQPELTSLLLGEFQKSGLDLQQEFCGRMEQGLAECEGSKKQCEQIGMRQPAPKLETGEDGGPSASTCPPDQAQLAEACRKRTKRDFERELSKREEDLDIDCNLRWEFEHGNFEQKCEGGQLKLPEFCDKGKYIGECVQRMPKDFGRPDCPPIADEDFEKCKLEGRTPQTAPDANGCKVVKCMAQQPPVPLTTQQCPPFPQAEYLNCKQGGGLPDMRTDSRGCVTSVVCRTAIATFAPSPTAQCQPFPQEDYDKCKLGGGLPQFVQDARGCKILKCQWQPTAQPTTGQCPQYPYEQVDKCKQQGGSIQEQRDSQGCVASITCTTAQPTPVQPTTQPCLSIPPEEYDKCKQQGGAPQFVSDARGCKILKCQLQSTPQPTTAQCPQEPEEQYQKCKLQGGSPQAAYDQKGCMASVSCIMAQPAPQQTAPAVQCPQYPYEQVDKCKQQGGSIQEQRDSQGCVASITCTTAQPTPATTAVTPQPTATPANRIISQRGPAPYSGFIAARSAEEACVQEWERNQPQFQRQCEDYRRGGNANICNKDSFVASCRQEELNRMVNERGKVNYDRVCELEAKRAARDLERYCKDSQQGRSRCIEETERNCESGRRQIARCKELTGTDKVKEAIANAVAKKCRLERDRQRINLRTDDASTLPEGEAIPVVVAVKETISADEVRQLEQAVQRVEGFYTISGLRIYSVVVKASGFSGLMKQLPFVVDAKLDHVTRSLQALEKSEGRLSGLDRTVTALQATQQLLPTDQRNLVEYEADNVAKTKQKMAEVSKDKGFGYGLQQVLGMKAEQEKKEAEELKAESERLTKTIERLKQLVQQVDDVALQGVLSEQIKDLEAQQKSIQAKADAKKKGAAGLFSLFGLLG